MGYGVAPVTRSSHRWWLESSVAAAISRAIPASYILVSATGRQIKPGALDHKPLQTYIEHHTGLPFRAYPRRMQVYRYGALAPG